MVRVTTATSWGSTAYAPRGGHCSRLMTGSAWGRSAYLAPCDPTTGGPRKTLVLDMDETLIHTKWEPVDNADWVIDITLDDGTLNTIYVLKRPGLEEFLIRCCELFNVIIWTAGQRAYAEPIIRRIVDAAGSGVNVKTMYRDSCSRCLDGTYAKDLLMLDLPSLDVVGIVDNTASVAVMQPKNYIPIRSWHGESGDAALPLLLPLLERFHGAASIYEVLTPYYAHARHPAAARC